MNLKTWKYIAYFDRITRTNKRSEKERNHFPDWALIIQYNWARFLPMRKLLENHLRLRCVLLSS